MFCLTKKKRKIDLAKENQGNTTTKTLAFVIFEHCYQETRSKRMGLSKLRAVKRSGRWGLVAEFIPLFVGLQNRSMVQGRLFQETTTVVFGESFSTSELQGSV